MKLHLRISLLSYLVAGLIVIAIPLISEITGQGRGGEASRQTSAPSESLSPSLTTEHSSLSTTDPLPPDFALSDTLQVYLADREETISLPLEDYLVCVVAAEMPYTFHTEALKAQAVAARTYCLYQILGGTDHEGGADVCTNYAHCAAFISEEALIAKYGTATAARIRKTVKQAVDATAGEILTYNGEPILAVFHSRSYRYTESSANVWGGALPYLVSVPTPEEDSISTAMVSDHSLQQLFDASTITVSGMTDPSRLLSQLNTAGRVELLFYKGKAIEATQLRAQLGLRSCSFTYEKTADGWLFTVHGYGHGVGMSQYGANEMAKQHADYRTILTHYYTGVTLTTIQKAPLPTTSSVKGKS